MVCECAKKEVYSKEEEYSQRGNVRLDLRLK